MPRNNEIREARPAAPPDAFALNVWTWGWNAEFEREFERLDEPGLIPARVTSGGRGLYSVMSPRGSILVELSGLLRHRAESGRDLPVTGDWTAIRIPAEGGRGIVRALLPRRTRISRKRADTESDEQVLAANVDTALLVSALEGGRHLNPRRIERYLTVALESGVEPIVVLSKSDLCENVQGAMREVETVAQGVEILAVSAVTGEGVDDLKARLPVGRTAVLLGMSGVGKSALINALLDRPQQSTGAVREGDLRGRHTTTRRELFLIPDHGMIIDTPGLREIQPWMPSSETTGAFPDIDALAAQCRFNDCRHEGEPGCAVQRALTEGLLDRGRYENYLHMKKEQAWLVRKVDEKAARAEENKWKRIARNIRAQKKHDRGLRP